MATSLPWNRLGPAVLVASGALLALVQVPHAGEMPTTRGALLEAVLPLLLALSLSTIGYRLHAARYEDVEIRTVVAWTAVGFGALAAVGAWVVLHYVLLSGQAHHGPYVVLNLGTVGALGGVLVGVREVRIRREERNVERARDQLSFLNRLLRHHVLNGVTVICGYADVIAEEPETASEYVSYIQERGTHIGTLVERVNALSRAYQEGVDRYPVPLRRAILEEVAGFERRTGAEVDVSVPDVDVASDELLETAVDCVLTFVHEQTDDGRLFISGRSLADRVVLSVGAAGPGLEGVDVEDAFDPGWHGDAGLDLHLARMLVEGYGGAVRGADDGTAVVVEVPLAELGSPGRGAGWFGPGR